MMSEMQTANSRPAMSAMRHKLASVIISCSVHVHGECRAAHALHKLYIISMQHPVRMLYRADISTIVTCMYFCSWESIANW